MAALTTIDPKHWKVIVERIHDKQCVPFLGSAVNINKPEEGYYKGLPIGKGVTLGLLKELLDRKTPITDWLELAEVVARDERLSTTGDCADLSRIGMQNLARVALLLGTKVDIPYLTIEFRIKNGTVCGILGSCDHKEPHSNYKSGAKAPSSC